MELNPLGWVRVTLNSSTTLEPSLPRNGADLAVRVPTHTFQRKGERKKEGKKFREKLEPPTSPNQRRAELKAPCLRLPVPLTESLLQPRAAEAPQPRACLRQTDSDLLGQKGAKTPSPYS